MKQFPNFYFCKITNQINLNYYQYEPIVYPLGLWMLFLCLAFIISHLFQTIVGPVSHYNADFHSWDGSLFLGIAKQGYISLSSTASFPLFPLLIHYLHLITHWPLSYCGLIISNLAYLISLIFLYKLSLIKTEGNQDTSRRLIWLMAVFPTAIFFNAAYPDSLTLLSIVLFFYFLENDKWLLAMVSGFFAAAVYTLGIILAPVGLCYLFRKRNQMDTKTFWLRFFCLGIIASGLLLYMEYLQLRFGNSFYFLVAEKTWHPKAVMPVFNSLQQVYMHIFFHPHALTSWMFVNIVNNMCVLYMFFLGSVMLMCYRSNRLITFEMKVFFILTFIASFSYGAFDDSITLYSRFMNVLFPGFLVWADKIRNYSLFLIFLALMLTIKILFQGLFVCGYPV